MEIENITDKAFTGRSFKRDGEHLIDSNRNISSIVGYSGRALDLNEQLISNKSTTFFFRMNGNSMMNAGIFDLDTLVVDRSIKAVDGKIIIAILHGKLLVRRLEKGPGILRLLPENSNMQPVEVHLDPDFKIWGVVTYSIHSF